MYIYYFIYHVQTMQVLNKEKETVKLNVLYIE